jgi:hypothetical protein
LGEDARIGRKVFVWNTARYRTMFTQCIIFQGANVHWANAVDFFAEIQDETKLGRMKQKQAFSG